MTKHAGPATVIPASVPAPSTVATAVVPSVKVYAGPATTTKPVLTLSNPNNLGQPLVFLVDKSLGTWLQVYLPHRPNESTGWIPAGDVTLASDNVTVLVQLSQHQVTVMRNGSTVDTIPVAVGDSSGPTPTGNFYVTEVIKVPANQPFFGPYAFGLSAFSNVYHSFDGGPGQTAMHGTDQPSLIGQNVSHGCIRMSNASATRMANEVPLGTPVDITA
ncbi:MAG: L,D-transpeptidase [Acidimicrobiales bacterium]